ncbi:MAG: AzlC family ABC transporter permease [Pseudomonadota bacterium]
MSARPEKSYRGPAKTPAWTENATPRDALLQGLRATPLTPGIILFCAMIGFGAFARDAGFSLMQSLFITASIFQLPGQVALVDQTGRGAAGLAIAFAVLLTAIRLLPMTVVLMPYLRGAPLPRLAEYAAAHFVAITAWVEALRRLPALPQHVRLPFFLGFALLLCSATLVATAAGYLLAGALPPRLAAVLLFLTPIYFILSLIAAAASRADRLAIPIGAALGPLLFLAVPGLDLLATGVIGGTFAFALGELMRKRSAPPHPEEPPA